MSENHDKILELVKESKLRTKSNLIEFVEANSTEGSRDIILNFVIDKFDEIFTIIRSDLYE